MKAGPLNHLGDEADPDPKRTLCLWLALALSDRFGGWISLSNVSTFKMKVGIQGGSNVPVGRSVEGIWVWGGGATLTPTVAQRLQRKNVKGEWVRVEGRRCMG